MIFKTEWINYAVPFKNDQPDSCHRFDMVHDEIIDSNVCSVNSFNRSSISYCGDGPKIYRTDDVSIVNEVQQKKIFLKSMDKLIQCLF